MLGVTARPAGLPVHATVVAIGGRGLLIRGASRSGKSTLALALIAASTPVLPIELVGDDRVLLRRTGEIGRGGAIVAQPHPRIAGFIERRGLGLVAIGWRECAVLAGSVAIGAAPPALEGSQAEAWLHDLPMIALPGGDGDARDAVLAWWGRLGPHAGLQRLPEHRRRENDAAPRRLA